MLPPDPHTLAALLLAADPEGLGGAVLLGPGGPAAEGWCRFLRGNLPEGTAWRRVPVGVTPDRMTGGIDLGATLRSGRRVLLPGIPAEADGGVLVLPSAERIHAEVTATLLEVLDRGRLRVERDGLSADLAARVAVVALDEARDDEPGSPEALRDRVAFLVTLPPRWAPEEMPDPDRLLGSAARIRAVEVPDRAVRALAEMSLRGGSPSLRPVAFALRAARGIAALRGASSVEAEDVWLAAALVLAPRGVPLPAPPGEAGAEEGEAEDAGDMEGNAAPETGEASEPPPGAESPPPSPSPPPEAASDPAEADADADDAPPTPPGTGTALPDRLVAAVLALLPDEDAAVIRRRGAGGGVRGAGRGRGGPQVEAHERGRRVGAHPGAPGRGRRLDLPATLRAAAPWQPLRQVEGENSRLRVTREDLHVQRRVRPSTRRTIFAVDASGSQALRRLGEVKGAVELLLVDSYRAREEVCLVVFRDREAKLLLPPTRSLTRVKRLLRGLPGGGGTPLALGLAETLRLAEVSLREGVTPRVVLLTDGRPNVDAAGRGGRARAREDALVVAAALGARSIEVRVLDTGLRPEPFLDELARCMGARARHLPFADARRIRRALADPPPGEPVPSHPGMKSHG
ncbi:MAG: VWA domain-containing protein [Gemmatimonadales bacterium]|nr:MAG: VWA domain-containing protein [Gemmatimonadales bacterium]